jgi:hypothetical protein
MTTLIKILQLKRIPDTVLDPDSQNGAMRMGSATLSPTKLLSEYQEKFRSAAAEQMGLLVFPKYIAPVQCGAKPSPGKHYMK